MTMDRLTAVVLGLAPLVDPPTASLSSVFIPSVAEHKRAAYKARRG
jgi:hypothetical protein